MLDQAWGIHPRVAVRPESFGALLYHYDTRRLSFLKDPLLLNVVNRLDSAESARSACAAAGVVASQLPAFERALATLASTDMICERSA